MSIKKSPINFSTVWDSDYWMESNGMYCGFNMPEALVSKSENEDEFSHGLPPYNKRKIYLSDEYPAVPKNWVPSEGRKTSYFVPVKEGYGMWLDFNKNSEHKYEVAIVVSVQGVNPITGMPCADAGLEQYIDTCPKHDVKFGPHRYCDKCGYKWPKQNYICTTGTPNGNLWLDGFRAASGVVRQYILTMDKIKGVAANIIKEDRVFAVGVSFFLSVNPKPIIQQQNVLRSFTYQSSPLYTCSDYSSNYSGGTKMSKCLRGTKGSKGCGSSLDNYEAIPPQYNINVQEVDMSISTSNSVAPAASPPGAADARSASYAEPNFFSPVCTSLNWQTKPKSVNVKKVEIGAGANIGQQVHDDPEPLEFWRKEPESLICINYVLEEDAVKILKAGKISLEGHKESFLKDIPKGNKKNEEKKETKKTAKV